MHPPQLPDQEPSPAIAVALAESELISEWIGDHSPGQILEARNHRLAAGHFAVCLEHREATLLLISQGTHGSAHALWRPTYENYMRGHWALNVAQEADLKLIAETKAFPKFDTIIKRLDATSDASEFAKTKAEVCAAMSDFAHGGVVLLSRWFGPDGIGSNHPDAEVLGLITRVNAYGLLASMGVNYMAGDEAFPESVFLEKVKAVLPDMQGP